MPPPSRFEPAIAKGVAAASGQTREMEAFLAAGRPWPADPQNLLPIEVFDKSVPGTSHAYEDRTMVDEESRLYAVADGVTSSSRGSGAIAADRALMLLEASFSGNIAAAVSLVHKEMVRLKKEDETIGETTLTALHIREDDVAEVANVGDSPCYLLRGQQLHVLTQLDETARGAISQTIGYPEDVKVHRAVVDLRSKDYLILASDGVAHVLNHVVLLPMAREEPTAKEVAETIIERASEMPAKYDDDKSVIVIQVLEAPPKPSIPLERFHIESDAEN